MNHMAVAPLIFNKAKEQGIGTWLSLRGFAYQRCLIGSAREFAECVAASRQGISPQRMNHKMKKYGIDRRHYQQNHQRSDQKISGISQTAR